MFHLFMSLSPLKLALGQNSTEIMSSNKSNFVAMFWRIQTDIYILFSFRFLLIHYDFTIITEILGTATYGMVRP